MSNATRLLDIIRRTLVMASEGGNYYDQKDEYLDFISDVCWCRLQDKIKKVPRFPARAVPRDADVSTISSILNIIFRLLDAWDASRVHSQKKTVPRQEPRQPQSIDTLKHCFEQVFHPLDDTDNRLDQLRRLWRCCSALMKSEFFTDVFCKRMESYSDHAQFLYRVYRRILGLYSYRKGMDVFLHTGVPYLISLCHPYPPDIALSRIPRDPPSTIQMDATPDQFIFQKWGGNLAQDYLHTAQARLLWSVNETKTISVHPLVSMCNFLYSSGTRVIQDYIGTSRRPCNLCQTYSLHCYALVQKLIMGINSEWIGPFRKH